jgi:hypothetical protein
LRFSFLAVAKIKERSLWPRSQISIHKFEFIECPLSTANGVPCTGAEKIIKSKIAVGQSISHWVKNFPFQISLIIATIGRYVNGKGEFTNKLVTNQ